jgi:hypothetical protein
MIIKESTTQTECANERCDLNTTDTKTHKPQIQEREMGVRVCKRSKRPDQRTSGVDREQL